MFITTALAECILAAPAILLAALGLSSLVNRPLHEKTISRLVGYTTFIDLTACLLLCAVQAVRGETHMTLSLGQWIVVPDYHFSIKFLFDRLSLPFIVLVYVLCGTVGAFTMRYLHREPGFNRFFVLYALFVLGMTMTTLAGTIETLFAGWELVGLSSALLVAFFHERREPVRNGLRVWSVYRITDAALVIAAVVMHRMHGEGDFETLVGTGPWPVAQALLTPYGALLVGSLLLIAAAGKSALLPFSGWLPRAMEGPTPSSAVFYGALSVHMGAYLLLRAGPILELSPLLSAAVVALGLVTALFAALTARVLADIKGALAFASLTQVGIIVAEIGLGLRYLVLAHIIGHACLRTLQFLRAPTLLHDYHQLENAIGSSLPRARSTWGRSLPKRARIWFYCLALERGHLDACLAEYIVSPFFRVFQWFDAVERRWTRFLAGEAHAPHRVVPPVRSLEELI
jgi:NAD(P)H-quinone oxidoreductase subunit 5